MTVRTLLDRLDEGGRRGVRSIATRRRFARGEVLFHQGDPGDSFHIVDKGHVKVSVLSLRGDSATLSILGPDDGFGEQALLSPSAQRTATVTALEPTQTLALHRDDFNTLRARHPEVTDFLVEVLAEQVRRLSEQLVEARFVPAEQRIARRLLSLAQTYTPVGGGEPVDVPLSQEELAQIAGTTRPTVNRFLRDLGDAVALGRGRVTIRDIDSIAERA